MGKDRYEAFYNCAREICAFGGIYGVQLECAQNLYNISVQNVQFDLFKSNYVPILHISDLFSILKINSIHRAFILQGVLS